MSSPKDQSLLPQNDAASTPDLPLRKSFLSGSLRGWTLDVPPGYSFASMVVAPTYFALAPLAYRLTRPTGYFAGLLDKYYGPRDTKAIIALVALAVVNTYVLTAQGSIYAQACHPRGYQNAEPRRAKLELRGLQHRLISAHQAVLEAFPAFATTALLVYTSFVNKSTSNTSLIDGLFFNFLLKQVIYPLVYAAGDDFNRTNVHILSVSTLMSVLWELWRGL